MKSCPQCGTQVPDEGQFCPSCGAAVPAPEPPAPEPPAPVEPEAAPPAPPAPPAPEPPAATASAPEPPAPVAPAPTAPPAPPAPEPPAAGQPPVQPAAPQYQQPYAAAVQPPKKSRKGLIIAIVAVVLIVLLSCCGIGAWLVTNADDGTGGISIGTAVDEDQAKIEAIETLAIGLGTLDFDMIREAAPDDAQSAIDAVEMDFTEADIADYAQTLLSSEWDGDTLVMTFEDSTGYVTYIRIYPPTDGGTDLYTIDWDDYYTEDEGIRTDFVVIDEGGWKVYSIDGETLTSYFGY